MNDKTPEEKKSLLFGTKRPGPGRGLCAAAGIAIAGGLYYGGFAPAEPTILSGVAYAAVGAAGGVLVYGVFDFVRRVR